MCPGATQAYTGYGLESHSKPGLGSCWWARLPVSARWRGRSREFPCFPCHFETLALNLRGSVGPGKRVPCTRSTPRDPLRRDDHARACICQRHTFSQEAARRRPRIVGVANTPVVQQMPCQDGGHQTVCRTEAYELDDMRVPGPGSAWTVCTSKEARTLSSSVAARGTRNEDGHTVSLCHPLLSCHHIPLFFIEFSKNY